MRIAKFINEIVGQRRLNGDKPSAVVMKLDVEGMEIHSGALRHLDNVHIDFHWWMNNNYKLFR